MNPIADRIGHTGVDPRMKLMLALTVVVGLPAVPQRTGAALLAPQADGFLGGLAVGLAASTVIGWVMSR
jgi:hypothetical protein